MEEPMRVAITTKPSMVALLNMIETLIPVITFYNVRTGCPPPPKKKVLPTRLNGMTN
jgi:hypothetical protein